MALDILTTILGGVASGGATGLLGIVAQRYFDIQAAKAKLENDRENNSHARMLHEMDIQAEERRLKSAEIVADRAADAQERVAELDAEARATEAEAKMRLGAYENDKATYSVPDAQSKSRLVRWLMGIVDAARGLVRPVATGYLLWMTTTMWFEFQRLTEKMKIQYTSAQVQEVNLHLIGSITFCTTTAVVFWFGSRTPTPVTQKKF